MSWRAAEFAVLSVGGEGRVGSEMVSSDVRDDVVEG